MNWPIYLAGNWQQDARASLCLCERKGRVLRPIENGRVCTHATRRERAIALLFTEPGILFKGTVSRETRFSYFVIIDNTGSHGVIDNVEQ
jgi:hypothetical protein